MLDVRCWTFISFLFDQTGRSRPEAALVWNYMNSIENIILKANKKKNISLRLKTHDIEQLKLRADSEGLPYQTLLSSIVHKFVTDQLVDKKNILKSIELLKAQNTPL